MVQVFWDVKLSRLARVYCTCEDSAVFIAWWVVITLVRTVLSSLLGEWLLHVWGQSCLHCLVSGYCTCEDSALFIVWWVVTALVRTVLSSLLGEWLLHLWGQCCLHCLVSGYCTCEDSALFIVWWVVITLVRTVLSSLLCEWLLHLWGCLHCLVSGYCTCEDSALFIVWWVVTALVRTVLSSLLGEWLLHLWGQCRLHCQHTNCPNPEGEDTKSFETSRYTKSSWPFRRPLAGNRVTFLVIPACSIVTILTELSCILSFLGNALWHYSKCSMLGVVGAWQLMLRASADRVTVTVTRTLTVQGIIVLSLTVADVRIIETWGRVTDSDRLLCH